MADAAASPRATITVAEVLTHHVRGGFLYTRVVSQRIGAPVTVVGVRRAWSPALVTAASVVLSVLTSVLVLAVPSGVAVAIVATLGWQLAYGLDCSDGQLARATGRTSAAGAAFDLYGDALGRLVMLVAAFASMADRGLTLPTEVVVVLVAAAFASLFHEAANRIDAVADRPVSRSRAWLETVRDPGLSFLAFGVSLALPPGWTLAAIVHLAAFGALQFGVRMARLVVAAFRA